MGLDYRYHRKINKMMDFEERFGGPVVLARQIGLRWNRSKNTSIRCNSMPFLVRCLSYIRNAKHSKQNKFTRIFSKSTERLTIAQLINNWRGCRKPSRLEPEVVDLTSDTDSPKEKSCEKRKIEAISKTSAIVYLYYLHYESNFPAVQVEIVTDLRCPFCSIQLPSDASFILHCRTFHFGLNFDCGKDERNKLHVLVRGDPSLKLLAIEKYNKFVFCSSRKRRKAKNVPFIKRPASTASLLDPMVRRSKIAQLEGLNAEAGVINQYLRDDKAPLRQYYSSRTNLPLFGQDWNYDSDDDAPEDWLTQEKDEVSFQSHMDLDFSAA